MRISKNLLSIIEDILDGHFDERVVKLLSPDELSVLDIFIRISKYPIVLDKEELRNFQKDFDILLGEVQSGNDNPKVKNELKRHVLYAMKHNRMKKSEGLDLLLMLSC